MGGEMVYILDQRLRAQSIPVEKSRKVLTDVVRTMYSAKFIAELFKPQTMYSNRSTRQIFDRLAHSSIMRLNQNSMDKLYDLMTMGFKYQIIASTEPSHVLQVTLNHLDAMKALVDNRAVTDLIESAMRLAIETYGSLRPADWYDLKHSLTRFFQDRRVKVSLFLQDGIQNLDGTIVLDMRGPVPIGSQPPGTIHYVKRGTRERLDALTVPGAEEPETGDPLRSATRPCKLGGNMYLKERKKGSAVVPKAGPDAGRHARGGTGSGGAAASEGKSADGGAGGAEHAKAGLNLLASLLGGATGSEGKDDGDGGAGGSGTFKLQLFAEDPFDGRGGGGSREASSQVITIDATDRETMEEMMAKLDMDDGPSGGGKEDDDDLLALMDSAT